MRPVAYISFCFSIRKNRNVGMSVPAVGVPAAVSGRSYVKIVTARQWV